MNEFFNSFKKDHTFYIDGNQIKFCKTTDIHVIWDIGRTWSFLLRRDINAVTIEGASLTITARNGRKYTFIAKPKSKEEMAEEIILLLRNKLTRIFYDVGIKEDINEIIYFLDELERINKE
jgi:hypothetical protein